MSLTGWVHITALAPLWNPEQPFPCPDLLLHLCNVDAKSTEKIKSNNEISTVAGTAVLKNDL